MIAANLSESIFLPDGKVHGREELRDVDISHILCEVLSAKLCRNYDILADVRKKKSRAKIRRNKKKRRRHRTCGAVVFVDGHRDSDHVIVTHCEPRPQPHLTLQKDIAGETEGRL